MEKHTISHIMVQRTRELRQYVFIQFDVVDFYPSITEKLLNKALEYAKQYIHISDEDHKIIFQARRSFLFNNGTPWNKKKNSKFDVAMGSFDGAECCELVGLYMLSLLQHLAINVGLYRDDGLGVSQLTHQETEQIIQEISRIFKQNDLSITSNVNHKKVDFLDVNLDLSSGLFKPYKKENDCPIYIHKHSNHPPSVIKNIHGAVNQRFCSISSNAAVFSEETSDYQTALANGGHTHRLEFTPPTNKTKKRNRGRRITWLNPPYSANVATNIGAKFLKIIDKCFPPTHPLAKIINRNTV